MEKQIQLSRGKTLLYCILSLVLGIAIGSFFLPRFFSAKLSNTVAACPKCDYSREPGVQHISAATARMLATNYQEDCQSALSALIPHDSTQTPLDARCAQFSLASLKKYIWDIESSVCGCDSFKDLGIRFYYGKYPDLNTDDIASNPDLRDVDKKYSFLHTLFLVPTYKNADGIDQDFEPMEISNCRSGAPRSDGSTMSIMNHGNLSPPPFPENNAKNVNLPGLKY